MAVTLVPPNRYVASDDKQSVESLREAASLDPRISAEYSFRQVRLCLRTLLGRVT